MYQTDHERWTAIAERDRRAEGSFVYSVATTGIYCRPGCPSRLPRRENVRFHVNAAAAERAGFRPCKRCRPLEIAIEARNNKIVSEACRLLEDALDAPSLGDLAERAGLSRFHFHRIFKSVTGVTPKDYADARRAERARAELAAGTGVTEAIYAAGFQSSGRFYAASDDFLGMTPSAYKKGGAGMTIRYGFGACSLGQVLVAATPRGLCAIALGDDREALLSALRAQFAKAELVSGDATFRDWIETVVRFVDAPAVGLDLPLDLQGTAFQIRVWQALRDIGPGETLSYAELAARLGKPNSVRAVAGACAANRLAVAIPCHRVVGRDGSLTGYRWGLARKRALLDREGQ